MMKLLGPNHPFIARTLGRALVLATLCVCAPLYAQTPATPSIAPAPAYGLKLGLYLLALLTGLAGLGWYVLRRARPQHILSQDLEDELEPSIARQLIPPPLPAASSASHTSARHGQDSGRFHVDALQVPTESSILKPIFTTRGEGQQKLCPACKKTYASWMVICPVDASALVTNPVAAHERRKQARQAPTDARSTLTRMRCPSCQRRVAQGASFCPYDGKPLVVDTIEDAKLAPEHKICRHCGVDPTQRAKPCRSSACDITTLNPSLIQAQLGGIAMTICPRCHAFGQPGQLHCEHDQELLVPMTSVELGALPHTGYGERRKICSKCAARFGGDYQHCAYDGTALTPLN